jgi:hypothetical protein
MALVHRNAPWFTSAVLPGRSAHLASLRLVHLTRKVGGLPEQLPKAVAYIVLSSRDEASYGKDSGALQQVLKTFLYLEPKADKKAP